jgi:hypothetical protein
MKPKRRGMLLAGTAVLLLTFSGSGVAAAALPEFSSLVHKQVSISGGTAEFENHGGLTVRCSASKGEATITGTQTATGSLTFTGCILPAAQNTPCQTKSSPSGEVKTTVFPVRLVYLSKEKHEAALVFNYEEPKFPPEEHVFVEAECGSVGVFRARGPVVVPITPVNTRTTKHTVKMAQVKGEQQYRTYENAEGKVVSAFPKLAIISTTYEEGGIADSLTWTSLESLEVKA